MGAQDSVAAYSFDAGEGTTAEDVTGNEHEGTIEGAEWFENGKYGSALDFHGEKGECLTVPDAEDLRITEELTVEAWVKPRSPLDDDPIVDKSAYGYTGDALGIGIFNSGKPEGFIGEGEGEYESVVGPAALEANVWTHLAFTFDGAHMRLYVNGELAASKAQSEGAPWGEGDLVIGCNPNFPSEVFKGLIDEVRIYNRALGAGEIGADAGAGLQTPQNTPVAAYSFDAGEGETLEDVTGDEHEGAIEGATWFDNGRFGKALDFDGENDCVTVEDAPDLQLTEELTLEAWVKPEGSGKSEPVIFKETPFFGTYSLYLGIGEEGHMEGLIGEEGYVFKDTEDPEELEAGVWSHVALTFDGAHMRLYVNGELVDTTTAEGAWSSTGPLSIGCSVEFEDNFDGKIDEVRIYNRALSASELAADAGAGLQTPSRDPVAAYSFDAGEGEVAEDAYGEHDGAIEGATWFENGRFGKALSFDGEDDCVTVEDAPDLQLTEELTLETWVKPEGSGISEPVIFKETPWFFGYSLYFGINEHGHMEGLIGEEGYEATVTEDPAKLETNVWSHVALTFDGAHMRLYVNGALVDTSKAEGPWGTTGPLSIGCSEEFEDNFKGLIDEVRIYNRALGANEITADMGAEVPNPPTATTGGAEVLGPNEAIFSGTVDPSETETRYRFEYGTTTAYGQMAPATEEEVLYAGTDQVAEEAVAYLQPSTTYHYRLVATNRAGTAVGEDDTLTTPPSEVSPEQETLEREEEENYTASISTVPPDFLGLNFRGLEDDMGKVAETGASMYRISLENLTHFSSERSKYDKVFLDAAANHMKVLFVLGGRHLTTNKTGLATWVERIVRRYGKANAGEKFSIWGEKAPYAPTYWEVWNEPNIGLNSMNPPPQPAGTESSSEGPRPGNVNPKQFGNYLEAMSKAIKHVEPKATVILGGLLSVGTQERTPTEEKKGKEDEINPEKFLTELAESGHTDDYDAVGFHPYAFKAANGKAPQDGSEETIEVNQVREKIRQAIRTLRIKVNHLKGAKTELWITEVGWPVDVGGAASEDTAHPPVTEKIQAKLLTSVFSTIKQRAKAWNLEHAFYYDYRDSRKADQGGEKWDAHTGLLDEDLKPREAFEVFQLQAK